MGPVSPGDVLVDKNGNPFSIVVTKIIAGASTSYAWFGGSLFYYFVDAGSGASETDLYTDTMPANVLHTNGDQLTFEYAGVLVSSVSATRELKVYFAGSSIFDTGALTFSLSSAWVIYGTLIRVSATVVRYSISFTTEGTTLAAYTAVGELTGLTLTAGNILKITGTSAGVGAMTNDIVAKLGNIFWWPSSTEGGSGGGSS